MRPLVVQRRPEPALLVSFSPELERGALIAAAVRIGHAFGNQHVPLEVHGNEVRIPITTSGELARDTVTRLELPGVRIELAEAPLGRRFPMSIGHSH